MLRSVITYIVVAVVTMTTVLQFHHHDCDGHVYINLTTATDITLGSNHSVISECNHNHNKPHKCNGEQNCAMHLGVVDILRQHTSVIFDCFDCSFNAISSDIIQPDAALTSVARIVVTPYLTLNSDIITRLGTPFRAPPII